MVLLAHDVLVTYGTDDHLLSLWETRDMDKVPTTAVKVSFTLSILNSFRF